MDATLMASIASASVSVLVPYLHSIGKEFVKGIGQEIGNKTGETAWNKAKHLYEFIKSKVISKPDAKKVIEALEKSPNDADTQAAVRFQLKEWMMTDETFAKELNEIVKNVSDAKPDTVFNTTILGNVKKYVQIGNVEGDVNL